MLREAVWPPVSVLLPAYNEEAAVGAQVQAIREVLNACGMTHEILVIDDGSEDRTAAEAVQAEARVLCHLKNRGYGASLKTGIRAAKYETIAIIDADGTYPPDQIPALVAHLATADMVVGARIGQNVQIPWLRRPAKRLLGWLANHIAGQRIPDLNSGLRVFRRECVIPFFPILSDGFSFTMTVTLALLADDYRVVYHPIDYYRRVGRSKIVPRHFMDFTILVLRVAMMFKPLKVFVPLAYAFGLLGASKTVFDIIALFQRHGSVSWNLLYEPVLSTSATLALLLGLHFLLTGMVVDGIVRRVAQARQPLAPLPRVGVIETGPFGGVREAEGSLRVEMLR